MKYQLFLQKMGQAHQRLDLLEREPLNQHTTFQIGGAARVFVKPYDEAALAVAVKAAKESRIALTVIGRGSNLLVKDEGIDGVVLSTRGLRSVRVEGNRVIAQAGATMKQMADAALEAGLTGAEFAAGIPGTVGGGVFMNAGAYGGQMDQIVAKSAYVDESGDSHSLQADEHAFAYRRSIYKDNPGWIITEAEIALTPGNPEAIFAAMEDFAQRRREKQPLEFPSAGSVFKRPEGYFAGQLIEKSGLKGASIGGAAVSEKHAGFIINKGGATCADVAALIAHVQKTVYDKFGVQLECEVRTIG